MGSILLVVFLVALAFAVPPVLKFHRDIGFLDGKIVGGSNISISEVPWQVSLEYLGSHICGGTIISATWVVTAAHCTDGLSASYLSVRAGTSLRESGGQVVNISRIHQHPDYDSWNINRDISILELSSALIFDSNIAAATLPSSQRGLGVGTIVLVTGWGRLSEGGDASRVLQRVDLPIVSSSYCKQVYGSFSITEHMLCAGGRGEDACQGDSGGPLVYNRTLYGIVSWGYGCARPGVPGVYTNVSTFPYFIKNVTGMGG